MESCKNCEQSFEGEFCHACGQKAVRKRLTFKGIIADGLSFMFSIESPLWRTTGLMFANPGKLIRAFISGKRKSYYRPFQVFIVAIVFYFLLRSLFDYDPVVS